MSTLQDVIGELKNQGDLNRNSGTNSQKAIKDLLKEEVSLLHYIREEVKGYAGVLGGLTIALEASVERLDDDLSLQGMEDEKERIEREKKQLGLLEQIAASVANGTYNSSDESSPNVDLAVGGGIGAGLSKFLPSLGRLGRIAGKAGWLGLITAGIVAIADLQDDPDFLASLKTLNENVGKPLYDGLSKVFEETFNLMVDTLSHSIKTVFHSAALASEGEWLESFRSLFAGDDKSMGLIGTTVEAVQRTAGMAQPFKAENAQEKAKYDAYRGLLLRDQGISDYDTASQNYVKLAEALGVEITPETRDLLAAQDNEALQEEIEALREELRLEEEDFAANPPPTEQRKTVALQRLGRMRSELKAAESKLAQSPNIDQLDESLKSIRVFKGEDAKALIGALQDNKTLTSGEYYVEYKKQEKFLRDTNPGRVEFTKEEVEANMDPAVVARAVVAEAQLEAAEEMRTAAEAGTLPPEQTLMGTTERILHQKNPEYERVKGSMFNYQKGGDTSSTTIQGDKVEQNSSTVIIQNGGESGAGGSRRFN